MILGAMLLGARLLSARLVGAVDGTGYRIVLLLHLLAVVAAFGPTLVVPLMARAAKGGGGAAADALVGAYTRITLPALVLVALLGMALVGLSDKTYEFSKGWVSAALGVWILVLIASLLLVRPALARVRTLATSGGAGLDAAVARAAMVTGILHLGLVVEIILMVWKPGQ